jgi:glycerophosphoryl diester phosphodiesterase
MGGCVSYPVNRKDHVAFYGATKLGRPLIYGHRGGSKSYPENSLEAFVDARENGADGCEMDVFLTTDGQVVVFHDDTTERLVDGPSHKLIESSWAGCLENLKFKKTLKYDRETLTFEKNYNIALLKDVFQWVKGKTSKAGLPFVLNVELKPCAPSPHLNPVGRHVANLIREYGMEAHVTLVGFDPFKLHQAVKTYPGIHVGWQYDDMETEKLGTANVWYHDDTGVLGDEKQFTRDKKGLLRFLMENAVLDRAIGATIVDLEDTVCDDNTIQKFHDKGFGVGCFTIFPTDLSSCSRKPPNEVDAAYEDGKNIIRQIMKRKVNWIETDSVKNSQRAMAELAKEFAAEANVAAPHSA